MAHQALYREWRPKIFDEVVEQQHVVHALRQAVISGQIVHAYLFSGTRGTGKTTLAKIFARAINCLEPQDGNPCNRCTICKGMLDGNLLDIVEMDAASNNSVDNIRRICDEVVFMPSQARFKVYIIDEVHMLSTGAFNALLKTLEEPPAHAVFILATTEPHRIPATILSRCQRYEFRRIPVDSLVGRLAEIANANGIDADEDALKTMAILADGALRDAISLLDQAKASFSGKIGRDQVLNLAGVVQDEFMQQMAAALLDSDAAALLILIDQLVMAGRDLARFVTDMAQHFRNILVCQVSDNPQQLVRASSDTLEAMQQMAVRVSGAQLIALIKGLSALLGDLRWAADMRTALEIGLIRLMNDQVKGQLQSPDTASIADPTPVKKAPAQIKTVTPVNNQQPSPVAEKPVEAPFIVEDPGPEPPPVDDFDQQIVEEDSSPVDSALELPQNDQTPIDKTATNSSDIDVAQLWQRTLDQLMADGHMTLYLFCRQGQPLLTDDHLQLNFAAADRVNFQEASLDANLKLLRQAATAAAGRAILVRPVLQSDPNINNISKESPSDSSGSDWIQKIRNAADTLGVPVKMEE